MFNKKEKKEEVYSSTDFSDLLSSPIFYSVIALTFILGLSSIFGFFNNPRKLKIVIDVISQKLLITPNSNAVLYEVDEDYLLQKYSLRAPILNSALPNKHGRSINSYKLSSDTIVFDSKLKAWKSTQRVSFDYDITSKQFWGDIDASSIESAFEESLQENIEANVIGVPLSSDYYSGKGDSKYSMRIGLLRL